MTSKVMIRPMKDSDLNFMLSRWLKDYKATGDMVRRMRDTEYFLTYEPIVKALLKDNQTLVACLTDDEDVIIGYICVDKQRDVLHWISVKETWRGLGIAKMLLVRSGITERARFTHWTKAVDTLINKYPDFMYNPFRL